MLVFLFEFFWIIPVLLLSLFGGVLSSEKDYALGGLGSFLLTLLGLEFLTDLQVFATILANPITVIAMLILYMFSGMAYAGLIEYPDYLRSRADEIKYLYAEYKKKNEQGSEQDFLESNHYTKYKPSSNKALIFAWVVNWPFSLLWSLSHKPFKWLYNILYESFGKLLDSVGTSTTKNILK